MELSKDITLETVAAISAAMTLFYEAENYNSGKIEPPPYIVLPSELSPTISPWRFVGRQEATVSRTMVQMKSMRW